MGSTRSINDWPLLPVFVVLISCFMQFSHAKDSLAYGESIADGQTLVSSGKNFILGFFSPLNSRNRYVGIWYYRVSKQTVVWVANRQNPLTDGSASLTINSNGNLMILNSMGASFLVATGTSSKNTSARLLDTGNLVLRDGNTSAILWQSFDYPTDTFLPHMKLGWDKIKRENRLLTSWRSSDDPAAGDYTLGLDPNGTFQFFIWRRGSTYWTSGSWNGEKFSLFPEMSLKYNYNFSFQSDEQGIYFTYNLFNDSIISRLVMEVAGQIQQFIWLESSQQWNLFWSRPRGACDVSSLCGAFGTCNEKTHPICECLKGFEPASIRDWSKDDWSGGCQRKSTLQCGNNPTDEGKDAFTKLTNMGLPANPLNSTAATYEQCKLACLNECSCSAYAYAERGCSIWKGDVLNLQQLSGDDERGKDLYLRLAASELGERSKRRLWVIIVVVIAILLAILGIFLCYLQRKKINKKELIISNRMISLQEFGATHRLSYANELDKGWNKGTELQLFSFMHITVATDNFCSTNMLGQGGFGPVYKGRLTEGQEIAVKRLSTSSGQGLEEFINEVTLIAKVQHMNLVRLLGCCIEGEEKMLIYEYLPNRSLDFFLFDPIKQKQLDWTKRVRIIEGIAQGLLYLHTYSRLRIIHRDLKTSNILLDDEMNPKISDFGMARIVGRNESEANTNRIVGTYGYMSPEYAMEGLFSEKSDVYSFGVVLLEIVCGKKNSSFYHSNRSLNFLGYAWELWKEGASIDLMDPTLVGSSTTIELTRYIHVALLCVQESASDRPTMSDVIFMLKHQTLALPDAKQPAFLIKRKSFEERIEIERQGICSINNVTVSVVEAR